MSAGITPGTRAEAVAEWVRMKFSVHRSNYMATAILQSELIRHAWDSHIDLMAWFWHPEVQATGIRGVQAELYPGATGQFFTLETKGGE